MKSPGLKRLFSPYLEPGEHSVRSVQAVVVLEAMKMENELKAAAPGVVRAVRVQAGDAVEKEQVLEFEDN